MIMNLIISCCIGLSLLTACNAPQEVRLLVGTYTENTAAEGVYLYSFNTKTADCTLLDCAPAGNPSFVITNPEGTMAYSVNEFNDGRQGVSSYALSESTIHLLDSVPIPKEQLDGEDPCNILYTGSTIVSSNYTGGTVSAFSLNADGRFAYLLCELSDHLVVFSYSDGLLEPIQDIKAYNGNGHGSADLHITPDGRFYINSQMGS